MLGFRQFRDVIAGILKGDELATARQRYWIFEPPFPAAISQRHAVPLATAACGAVSSHHPVGFGAPVRRRDLRVRLAAIPKFRRRLLIALFGRDQQRLNSYLPSRGFMV